MKYLLLIALGLCGTAYGQVDTYYNKDTSDNCRCFEIKSSIPADTTKAKFLCSLNDSLFIINGYWANPERKRWYVDWEIVPASIPLDENKKPLGSNIIIWQSKPL
jgi:hypothetical protein